MGSYLYVFVDHLNNNYSQIDGTTRHAKAPAAYEFWCKVFEHIIFERGYPFSSTTIPKVLGLKISNDGGSNDNGTAA